MYTLYRVSQSLGVFVTKVGKISAWAMILLMLVIVYDVFTRNILSSLYHDGVIGQGMVDALTIVSSTKLQETEWHLHGILLLMTFGFAYMRDAHVRIELVRDRMRTRTRLWIELVGILVALIPYTVVVMYFGYDFAHRAWVSGEVSAALTGLPHRWFIKGMLGVGFFVLFLAGLSMLLRTIVALFGPSDLRDQASRFVHPELEPAAPAKPE